MTRELKGQTKGQNWKGFEKRAKSYPKYNYLQTQIARSLLPYLKRQIIDLGAGNGEICRWKRFRFYLGVEISPSLARQNPCPVVVADFDTFPVEMIGYLPVNQIVSLSALHWSSNLSQLLKQIFQTGHPYLLTLFTSATFSQFHRWLGIHSPLPSCWEIRKLCRRQLLFSIYRTNRRPNRRISKLSLTGYRIIGRWSKRQTKGLKNLIDKRRLGTIGPFQKGSKRRLGNSLSPSPFRCHFLRLIFKLHFKTGRELLNYLRHSGVAQKVSAPLSKLFQFAKSPPFLTLSAEVVILSSRPIPRLLKGTIHFSAKRGG